MAMETSPSDLERKTETALAVRLKQHPLLKGIRTRRTVEDSAKVNQDLVIAAKRGEGNPPFSGIYNLEITVTLRMRFRKTLDTMPAFLKLLKAIEEVFSVRTYVLAAQLSLSTEEFHCYEVAVTGKDDSPQDNRHSCIWNLTTICMPQSYASASQIQSQT